MAVERIETSGNFCLTSLLLVCSITVYPEQRAVSQSGQVRE